jgi:hypothetical protein
VDDLRGNGADSWASRARGRRFLMVQDSRALSQPRATRRFPATWWICTNPRSPFVFGLIASINHDDGRREAIFDWNGPRHNPR